MSEARHHSQSTLLVHHQDELVQYQECPKVVSFLVPIIQGMYKPSVGLAQTPIQRFPQLVPSVSVRPLEVALEQQQDHPQLARNLTERLEALFEGL